MESTIIFNTMSIFTLKTPETSVSTRIALSKNLQFKDMAYGAIFVWTFTFDKGIVIHVYKAGVVDCSTSTWLPLIFHWPGIGDIFHSWKMEFKALTAAIKFPSYVHVSQPEKQHRATLSVMKLSFQFLMVNQCFNLLCRD
mgnify:CR=1 FL=1